MSNIWMPGVEVIQTAAFGGYGEIKPIAVINHIMQGHQSTMIKWAKERPAVTQKSAHFTISRSGRIVQHVPINQASWTSGRVKQPTWKLLRYVNSLPANPNSYVINIEHEGFSIPPDYGYDYVYSDSKPWPEAMVIASIEVQRWVCAQLEIEPNEDTITGHSVIDSIDRAFDPGTYWPKARVLQAIKDGIRPPPINKTRAYYAIYRGEATPIRREGKYGVYELKVKI